MDKYSCFFFIIYKDGSFGKEEFTSTQSQSKKEFLAIQSRLLEIEEDDNIINFTWIKGTELKCSPKNNY
ncbi:hypothetical protein [Tenacibaculum finnmarkense]|uniref:hypothetical protein n=1 Tax=Tenacibaculum finnmarkense TaxID=2781243 RepID=UPI00187B11A8|nr:hypothetical protein [Tenacibaculum finnmarkense]MBE7693661.1 hypothetical protein [Tenacibaculum finnmarkense genomovar finnmarkense]MCD8413618.1 hypothetical protein [Tenacibaculum finnmarkense genomovar ulcerans]MCD8418420.1 hypothetical protein [Tenacibaculum finnmarkense genomovar finnmarkense]MCD8423611.1 hypothetical protein [Tenacibaculum finnmarkense genomovar ulcerans]MCG8239715.1 hypothetical protein [Tenacibaculum finnmarkense genomovar ulcerans]